jgi:hypothetical protein
VSGLVLALSAKQEIVFQDDVELTKVILPDSTSGVDMAGTWSLDLN